MQKLTIAFLLLITFFFASCAEQPQPRRNNNLHPEPTEQPHKLNEQIAELEAQLEDAKAEASLLARRLEER